MNFSQLDQPIAVIQYPSLVQWLADRMAGAITLHPQCDRSLDGMALPLFKSDRTFGTFSSPLLLQWLKGTEPSRVQALGEEVLDIFRAEGTRLRDSALAPPARATFLMSAAVALTEGTSATHSLGNPPTEVASQVWGEITKDLGHFPSSLGGQCNAPDPLPISAKLWITPTGWLYAKFSPDDLTTWLQNLITAKPIRLPFDSNSKGSVINSKISADPVLFSLQHVHGRCHSLLRLAAQEKLLPPEELAHYFETCGPSLWQTKHGALHLHSPAEQAILSALMQFPQSLSPQKVIYSCVHPKQSGYETRVLWPLPPKYLYRQAIAWTQLFSNFHRNCRLFGTVHKETPQIVLARLALIYVFKNVLTFLLEDILHISAPLAF